ncbi:MAG: hypothetical protein MRZ79_19350, partial [Bacteroidia bacterium]|nr:hypothetical protein [Bacteroidia bacterium]
ERKTFNEDLVQISWHPNSQTLVALDRFENLRYALETPDETKFRKPFFLTDYNIRQRFSVLGFAFGREDPASKEVEVYYAYNYLDGQIWKTSIAKIGLSDEDILLVENNGNFYGDVRLRLGENSGEVVWLPTFANTGFFESLFYANIRNSQNFDLRFIPANLGKIKYNLSNDGKFLVYLGFNPALNKQVLIKRNILNEEEEIITFPTNNQIEVRDFDWSN